MTCHKYQQLRNRSFLPQSTVCAKIMELLGQNKVDHRQRKVAIISQDSFYKVLTPDQKAKALKGQYNFDHPGRTKLWRSLFPVQVPHSSTHLPASSQRADPRHTWNKTSENQQQKQYWTDVGLDYLASYKLRWANRYFILHTQKWCPVNSQCLNHDILCSRLL